MVIDPWEKILDEFDLPDEVEGIQERPLGSLPGTPSIVLFDIYGTLVKPLIGDLDDQVRRKIGLESFIKTARRFGLSDEIGEAFFRKFFKKIEEVHSCLRNLGITRPEVLVEKIWQEMLREAGVDVSLEKAKSFAIYRELEANPVAPFKGAARLIKRLKERGVRIGIVSNSQFYSLPISSKTLGLPMDKYVDSSLVFLSFELGFAKPDPHFSLLVKTRLALLGINAEEAVVIGNDLENDVVAASDFGFRAILFLGEGKKDIAFEAAEQAPVAYTYEQLKEILKVKE